MSKTSEVSLCHVTHMHEVSEIMLQCVLQCALQCALQCERASDKVSDFVKADKGPALRGERSEVTKCLTLSWLFG